MTPRGRLHPGILAAIAAAFLTALAFALHARVANGALGFPLDDAWIHLTYARTLSEHGTFAYYPGDRTTAGSTAPLFTLLEAIGLRIVSNERGLAIALGLASQIAFLAAFARWALRRLGGAGWAALAVLLVGLDGRVALLAVSGMETSLFLALLALAIDFRLAGRATRAGLALGAALWVRPDALILAAVFAVDAALEAWRGRGAAHAGAPQETGTGDEGGAQSGAGPAHAARTRGRAALATFGALAGVAAAYVAFNLAIGGRVLPATFAAKTAFYAGHSRLGFLTGDLAECFGRGAWLVMAPFAIAALVREAVALARRRPGALRLEAGFAVALPLAYLVLLPYAHRFTRYLIPALPAYALLGVSGLRAAVASARLARLPSATRATLLAILLAVAGALHARATLEADAFHVYACRYQADRQVRTGLWLAAHTPPDAVVATHDVGAIAYYSRRRIVDTVGLVSPEVVPWIGTPGYVDSLAALFDRRGVTHVAAFDEWLAVDDVAPLFTADPEPEVMRVYPWRPRRTHLLSEEVARLGRAATDAFAAGDDAAALTALRDALARDRASARLWVLLGDVMEREGRGAPALQAYRRANALFPDSPEIARRLAAASDSTRWRRPGTAR